MDAADGTNGTSTPDGAFLKINIASNQVGEAMSIARRMNRVRPRPRVKDLS